MKVYALWIGGAGYARGWEDDLETFPSIQAAADALRSRRDRGYSWRQDFEYVNKEPGSFLCPCVEDDSEMHVYLSLNVEDGRVLLHDNGPDRVITFGPRGGIRIDRN